MKKTKMRLFAFACFAFILLFSSCSAQKTTTQNANPVWWNKIWLLDGTREMFDFGLTRAIQDVGDSMYFFDQTGIFVYDFSSDTVTQILDDPMIASFCVDGDTVYFTKRYSQSKQDDSANIYQLSLKNPKKTTLFLNGETLRQQLDEEIVLLSDLRVCDGYIIFKDSGVDYIAFSLKTKEMFRLAMNSSSLEILDGYAYYDGRHDNSIYKKELRIDAQEEVLFGNGHDGIDPQDEEIAYKRVYVAQNHLFILQSNPPALFEWTENTQNMISTTVSADTKIPQIANNKVYYNDDNGNLHCYNPESKTDTIACDDASYRSAGDDYLVLRDRLFFGVKTGPFANSPIDWLSLRLK
ncbi:MAG: hypothetical protein LBB67_01985 [Oscillospiraceae bacterium]|jgi:hypothetical protein|nr:hypothetical protein [Oscillospiraceae bacterium]